MPKISSMRNLQTRPLGNDDFPIDHMVYIPTRFVPREIRNQARRILNDPLFFHAHWNEVGMAFPISPCAYGCKIYTRQQGAVTRYAIKHSSTYGHLK